MNQELEFTKEYLDFFNEVKTKIASAQIKAAIKVNEELIKLYWDLGKYISQKQVEYSWGDKFIDLLSKDLTKTFAHLKGFSREQLFRMKRFYKYYQNSDSIVSQLVTQIPWGHNIIIISKISDIDEAQYYLQQIIQNNWSRNVLVHQIESGLYQRSKIKIQSNFQLTLPQAQSDLASQTLKNSYIFDFLGLESKYKERDLESALIDNITSFLLELGKGFAFVGKQYHLEVDKNDFYN